MATAKQARPTTKFDEIKSDIVTWLNSELATQIKSPSTLVFHEIFYAGSQVQGMLSCVCPSATNFKVLTYLYSKLGYCSVDSTPSTTSS